MALLATALFAAPAAARVSLTPINHDFGGQQVGTLSAPATFTLTVACNPDGFPNQNDCLTNDPLTPNVTVSGPFGIVNNNCTAPMPGNTVFGNSCTFQVRFAPPAVGSHTGIVDVGEPSGFGRSAVSGTGVPTPTVGPSVAPAPGAKKKCKKKKGKGAVAAGKKCKKKKAR